MAYLSIIESLHFRVYKKCLTVLKYVLTFGQGVFFLLIRLFQNFVDPTDFFFSVLMGCRVSLISSIKNLVILIGTIFLSQNNIESPHPVSDILPVYVFPLCTALNFYDFLYIFVSFLSVGLLLEIGHTHIF